MSREEVNKLRYTIALIAEFAKTFSMKDNEAFNYLKNYRGLDYLSQFYDVLHTLTFDDAIEAIANICHSHGGSLSKTKI